ncbi:MAG: hypothetical protein OXH96_02440 [Spirochaetaceae bacterium]|nr:hypothetical protein [Spirochaetaceae bacterium]
MDQFGKADEFLMPTTEPLTAPVAPRRFPTARKQWLPDAIHDLVRWSDAGNRRAPRA